MTFLFKTFQPRKIVHLQKVLSAVQARCGGHWCPDYIPGPYPKTKEEREAAAKKYNLLPEEYEPYPDDGNGFGDYPKLPYESITSKDPYYAWDEEELMRNYLEPVHVRVVNTFPEQDLIDKRPSEILKGLIMHHLTPVIITAVILYILSKQYFHHGHKKQYPTPGVVHYTFELDYGDSDVAEPEKRKIC